MKALKTIIAVALTICATFANAIEAPSRHALVIGNTEYVDRPLSNPAGDAELMAGALEKVGFKVTLQQDLGRKAMFATVNQFYDTLPKGATALVYFAGHGMQIKGANYLLPTDMIQTSEASVPLKSYPVQALLDKAAQQQVGVNIFILDACRNNPFQPKSRYRSFEDLGLARTTTPKGTLIAYSTAPGQQAEDGDGRVNSLYTETLAVEIAKPGAPIEAIFKQVADTVRKKTLDDQQPWYESSIVDEFFFIPPPGVQIGVAKAPAKTATNQNRSTRSSGVKAADSHWYMALNGDEWTQLDWDVMQRVKRLTRDEIPQLEHKAKSGNVVAMTTLGVAYREGLDKITQSGSNRTFRSGANNTLALKWLSMAAHAGFPMAQAELGEMYYQAQGVDRDLNQSIKWLELASRADYPRAKLDLAQAKMMTNPSSPEGMKDVVNETYRQVQEMMKRQQDGLQR